MHKQLIQLILGLLCLSASGLTFGQTGLQALQLSAWGYPTSYTETAHTINFNRFLGDTIQQPFFHIQSRFPTLSFLVARANGTEFTSPPSSDSYQHSFSLEDVGVYLSYRSRGNLYFRGLVGGPLYANTNGLQNYFHNTQNLDIEYRGAIGLRLGEHGAFNVELEFLGSRLTGEANMISIGARYQF